MQARPVKQRRSVAISAFIAEAARANAIPKIANKVESEFHVDHYRRDNVKMR